MLNELGALRLRVMHRETVSVAAGPVLEEPKQAGLELVGPMSRNGNLHVRQVPLLINHRMRCASKAPLQSVSGYQLCR